MCVYQLDHIDKPHQITNNPFVGFEQKIQHICSILYKSNIFFTFILFSLFGKNIELVKIHELLISL